MVRVFSRLLLVPVSLIALYFVAAFVGALISGGGEGHLGDADRSNSTATEVFLVAGPIHYDFLLPLTDETRDNFAELAQAGLPVLDPDARWLLIGWGAREFYTTTGTYADLSVSAVLRGIFGDDAVLRAEIFGALRTDIDLPSLRLDSQQYDRLQQAILSSFARNSGQLVPVPGNLSGGDRFFEAKGRFNLFRTCNTWIGDVIQTAGLRFGRWVPLPYSVTLSHAVFQAEQPAE